MKKNRVILSLTIVAALFLAAPWTAVALQCTLFPANNILNAPIDTLPVHVSSDDYVETIGASSGLHPDFGSGEWNGAPIGIPYVVVNSSQPMVQVSFYYSGESDPGPYPIPQDAPIEGGPDATGDRHVLVIDEDNCMLYELYDAHPYPDGSWDAGSGAIFDLTSHALRPQGWTSADAAGLPILPGLVRYEEILAGEITHAIRFRPSSDSIACNSIACFGGHSLPCCSATLATFPVNLPACFAATRSSSAAAHWLMRISIGH